MKEKSRYISLVDIIICVILAFAFAAASYYISSKECQHTGSYFLSALVYLLVFLLLNAGIRYALIHTKLSLEDKNKSALLCRFHTVLNKKHNILIIGLMIFVCWIPVLVILYPGTLINDTWGELKQFILFSSGKGPLRDNHPFLDTLIMGIAIVPLSQVTGQWQPVIFLYVIIQSFLTCLSFSYVICYIYKKLNLDLKVIIIVLIAYSLLPIYPASAQTVAKDSLSAWIFVLFLVDYLEIIRSQGAACQNKAFIIRFLIISILVCMTKKTCPYIVIPSLLGLVLFVKPFRKTMLITFLCVLVLNAVVLPVVKNAAKIRPGGKQEPLSLPFQMSARYVKMHGEEITKYEYSVLDKVLDMSDLAERYNPVSADPVKGYKQRGKDQDYINYLKVWLKQGLRHPETYLEATDAMLAGWFSWYKNDPLMNMDWHSQLDTEIIPESVSVRTFNQSAAKDYQVFFDQLYNNPFIKVFLSYGLYATLIPAFTFGTALRRWRKKDIKYWLVVIPVLLVVIVCLGSPLSCHLEGKRYLYPLTYTAPLLVAWCIYIYSDNFSSGIQLSLDDRGKASGHN